MTLTALVQPSREDRYLIAAICIGLLVAGITWCAIQGQRRGSEVSDGK
jgi:hypothetical protein